MAFGEFFLRDTAGGPERARSLHLARSGSQSQPAIWVILPARGASYIIIERLNLTFTANGKNKTFAVCHQLFVQ